jgi:hypothetical protein
MVQLHRFRFHLCPAEVGQVGTGLAEDASDARKRRCRRSEPGDNVACEIAAGGDAARPVTVHQPPSCLSEAAGPSRPVARRAKSGDGSMPVNLRPSWIAASPAVSLPVNCHSGLRRKRERRALGC